MQSPPSNLDVSALATDDRSAERVQGGPETLPQWVFFGISLSVVVAAILLQVRGEEQVLLPGIGVPLPGTCTFKQYVGAYCPGCGLTRCFVSMGHVQLERAWHFNPVGIAFFAVVAFQIPFRATQLWRLNRGGAEIRLGWWGYSTMLLILAALILQWMIRMIIRFA